MIRCYYRSFTKTITMKISTNINTIKTIKIGVTKTTRKEWKRLCHHKGLSEREMIEKVIEDAIKEDMYTHLWVKYKAVDPGDVT